MSNVFGIPCIKIIKIGLFWKGGVFWKHGVYTVNMHDAMALQWGRPVHFLALVGRPYLWPAHFSGDVNFFLPIFCHYDW